MSHIIFVPETKKPKIMYNEYYPENTSPDCFENYGGHHIDDRMRARGYSYASHRTIDDKEHFATPEIMEEKRNELASLQGEYEELYKSIYGENSEERMAGDDLVIALMPLESLGEKIESLKHFIAKAHIIKTDAPVSNKVQMLSKVTVRIQGISASMTLRIVGQNDANPNKREVSCVSPVGKALLGRKVGDSVDVSVNGSVLRYHILSL